MATAEEFAQYLEKHRADFIKLTEIQEKELAKLYMEAAASIKERAELIIEKKGLTYAQAKIRINSLLTEASRLTDNFKSVLNKSLIDSANLGKELNKVSIQMYQQSLKGAGYDLNFNKILNKVSSEAVNYTFNKIWSDGLKLSDRVWLLDKRTKQEIERIVMQNIMVGGSASDQATLSALQNLLNPEYSPAKLTSLHGKKVSYEASRLLRTETAIAFNEADRLSALKNPGNTGQKWRAAPGCCPICERNDGESTENTGIPPAHPNCRCTTIEQVMTPKEFTDRWIKFAKDPKSDPKFDDWFRNIYNGKPSELKKLQTIKPKEQPKPKPETTVRSNAVTTKEAEQFLKNNGIAEVVKYSSMSSRSTSTLNEVNNTLYELFKLTGAKFNNIYTQKLPANIVAEVKNFYSTGKIYKQNLVLNEYYFNKPLIQANASIKGSMGNGWLVAPDVKGCTTHEFGHLVTIPEAEMQYEAWIKAGRKLGLKGISKYAETNQAEGLAELFTKYIIKGKSSLAEEQFETLDRFARYVIE